MATQNKPAAEIRIDEDLVRDLLSLQMPDLGGLEVTQGPSGWDNTIFRVGPQFAARLPRRQLGADLVAAEQRWLPELAGRLPLPIAAPLRFGTPQDGYPWSWSLVPWIEGEIAASAPLRDRGAAAISIGTFCASLHTAAPADAPTSACRGIPLSGRVAAYESRLPMVADLVDIAAVNGAWQRCLAAPEFLGAPVWLHGDLHPGNVIVRDGVIAGVIDFGDICGGDPATDFAIAFMMFDAADREVFREAAGASTGIDDGTWMRARGWALALGIMHLLHSADGPHHEKIGRHAIAAVLDDLGYSTSEE